MNIIFLIITLTLIAALAIGGIYFLYQVLMNYHPSKRKVQSDLRKTREEIQPWINELIPWKADELNLLSLNQVNRAFKKGIVTTMKGVFTSIYQEPMVTYAYRRYFSPQEDALLYARTAHREFVYRIKKGEVMISIDQQLVGVVRENGKLYRVKSSQLLAQIDRDKDELMLPITIKDREVAGLIKPQHAMNVNARAFEFVSEMPEEEEALLLSLSILELVKNDLPSK
ncbi:MAG: hypothetical protein AAF985_09690 [Bacteroidota bacterium]